MEFSASLPMKLTHGFEGAIGLELLEVTDDVVRAQVEVHDGLKQALGLVHGGVYSSIAESIASIGTFVVAARDGKTAQGMSNQTNFLRPIFEGAIHAVATARHKGRTSWVWEVDFTDDQGRLCALTRMTIAVRG
jgi:uncharacterized protein (TIGR00369 family)